MKRKDVLWSVVVLCLLVAAFITRISFSKTVKIEPIVKPIGYLELWGLNKEGKWKISRYLAVYKNSNGEFFVSDDVR